MTNSNDTDVHRLLDEAFAGIEMTPERQDLKEEVRANLIARAAELTAAGLAGDAAARQAIAELGDVHTILDGTDSSGAALPPRVRPRPNFVLRTVVLSALGVTGLAVLVLAATAGGVPFGAEAVAAFVVALAAGAVTADALRQETTSNHPMPTGRAIGYGAGVFLVLAGLACGWLYVRGGGIGWVIGGIAPVLAGAGILSYLGATQTNRHKQWVMRMAESHAAVGNRFTEDPSAAARFGIYTVIVWIVALAGFVLLTLTVGWLWSWLAIVGGVVLMMVLVARMLFVPSDTTRT
ncbi:permease prefix domain 1-containing protein [Actinoplanes sp. KI2]|uniref:permease prefix domain 1-containing protein n=1 Tax=Actinoplanes sp. KI2 TaxID=2983315 RepID=UPI0021D5B159|nr:permease prefix domain 1-containing protein [Actinoplanes sp. KI2]MCU7727992.1 permease prefix domain 1-containing protein [Actinoplanes sp. KI2]